MKKILILVFLLTLSLNASQILSYNLYERSDRVDLMITFDTPYSGKIIQSKKNSIISIKLFESSIENKKEKIVNTSILKRIQLNPKYNYTNIIATIAPSVILKASKTSDGYGLRLRFTKRKVALNSNSKNSLSSLPTKDDSSMTSSYIISILVVLIGIVFLMLKKITGSTSDNKSKSSWLFKSNQNGNKDDVNVRFQKSIDQKNKVVMLDYENESYLLLLGANNVLLEKFSDNTPSTQNDFEKILDKRESELDDFLQIDKSDNDEYESLKNKFSAQEIDFKT